MKGFIPFTATLSILIIQSIPADAQNAGQRIARALPPVQNALSVANRLVPARRANPGGMRNGLPPTNMDSFVYESGGKAWHIYGDEGVYSIPPFMEFTKEHRIEAGINGRRRKGLTTGHGSKLPDAWGGDEYVDGPEWSNSGAGGTRSDFQPFESIAQNMQIENYQTPPFVPAQVDPRISPPNPVREMKETSQDGPPQAMFGRPMPAPMPRDFNVRQSDSFNWP